MSLCVRNKYKYTMKWKIRHFNKHKKHIYMQLNTTLSFYHILTSFFLQWNINN